MMKNYLKNIIIMFAITFSIFSLVSINAFANDEVEIGVSNLNNTEENSAKLWDVLTHPEKGWKRYDDSNSKIEYNGTRGENTDSNSYKSIYGGGDLIYIKVYTSNFRLISWVDQRQNSWRSDNIVIEIDGEKSRFNETNDTAVYQKIVFEKLNMEKKVHDIKIYTDEKTTIAPRHNRSVIEVDAIDIDADGELLPYYKTVLNIEPEREKINLNQNVSANVVIDNITEIAAEDIRISYDSSKLQFLGAEQVDGIKIVKDEEADGQLRVILASQGKDNIANSKKTLLKLNFKGIVVGDALVDITKGRISDGIEMERDLFDDECGQATITVEDYKDPSKDGQFTLLDLAIDGRHFGENPADLPQYRTDVVVNGAIDDDDLLKIGEYMLENPNYSFN